MDQETETGTAITWRRALTETAIIVVGIAIALGADAAWDYRQDRVYERMVLEQLSEEFTANSAQFDTVVANHRALEAATLTLISAGGDESELGTDSIRALLRRLDTWWTFNPEAGALGSVIGSDRLSVIGNDSLRVALAGWPSLVQDYQENELNAVRYGSGYQAEFLLGTGLYGEIYFPTERSDLLQALVRDVQFRDVVIGRWSYLPNLFDEVVTVEAELGHILDLIGTELSR